MTPTDDVFMVPQMSLHVDLYFLWEKHMDSSGKSVRLNECVCKEVYVVVIVLGLSK